MGGKRSRPTAHEGLRDPHSTTSGSHAGTSDHATIESRQSQVSDTAATNRNPVRDRKPGGLNAHSSVDEASPPSPHGLIFQNLKVTRLPTNSAFHQRSVGNIWLEASRLALKLFGGLPLESDQTLLQDLEGIFEPGELVLVLGSPGPGCTAFLKTITGIHAELQVDSRSVVNYRGGDVKNRAGWAPGEIIYTANVDAHVPVLTIRDTLQVAARARTYEPLDTQDVKREMAMDRSINAFGLARAVDTRLGNEFMKGCSGGERKRVTIAEAFLSGAPLQAWDNSTRGLDSANAVEFCRTLRQSTKLGHLTAVVGLCQAPQAAYDLFDKVLVLYEGRQAFFGSAASAQTFFEAQGFVRQPRQSTSDFLVSIVSGHGHDSKLSLMQSNLVPAWKQSPQRARLLDDIARLRRYPGPRDSNTHHAVVDKVDQNHQPISHPGDRLSFTQEVHLCFWRGIRRIRRDKSIVMSQFLCNLIISLVLGSIFYRLPLDATALFPRSAVVFFVVVSNALGSFLEFIAMYGQRPVVKKHCHLGFYSASADTLAAVLIDLPFKIVNLLVAGSALYILIPLRTGWSFFAFFLLVNLVLTFTMSLLFRTYAASSKTLTDASTPVGIHIVVMMLFSGFAMKLDTLPEWTSWVAFLDPMAYAYRALLRNEMDHRTVECNQRVPFYGSAAKRTQTCAIFGAQPGQDFVDGDAWIAQSIGPGNKWNEVGGLILFMAIFGVTTFLATNLLNPQIERDNELHTSHTTERHESLQHPIKKDKRDARRLTLPSAAPPRHATLTWDKVSYNVDNEGQPRCILNNIEGWVRPGTITALMGTSGAGKTSLLDLLSQRATSGVVSGEVLVDGAAFSPAFQRKLGYVRQQDLHCRTATVREALRFSALLQEGSRALRDDKIAHADDVLRFMGMEMHAEATVGTLGLEHGKLLSIGVELAARPELLFLDEPLSGLHEQTCQNILGRLFELKQNGLGIMCSIHQPSAALLHSFDRLLLLDSTGQTIYFGPLGKDFATLVEYFERNGLPPCPTDANPADWVVESIASNSFATLDWARVWHQSADREQMRNELSRLKKGQDERETMKVSDQGQPGQNEFAVSFVDQAFDVTRRLFIQYWRTPAYIYSKIGLSAGVALILGLIFIKSNSTQQGVINQVFATFMLTLILLPFIYQTMPYLVDQRSLYEARERPAKVHSWQAFLTAHIVVETFWSIVMGVIIFSCFYFPISLLRESPGNFLSDFQLFLFVIQYMIWSSTLCGMVAAGAPNAVVGGNLASLVYILSFMLCGVLQPPNRLARIWYLIYRISPLTYFIGGILSTTLAQAPSHCAPDEFLRFDPRPGWTCGNYMSPYTALLGGYTVDPKATSACEYCLVDTASVVLKRFAISDTEGVRDLCLTWSYIVVNVAGTFFFYWLVRVPKKTKRLGQPGLAMQAFSWVMNTVGRLLNGEAL